MCRKLVSYTDFKAILTPCTEVIWIFTHFFLPSAIFPPYNSLCTQAVAYTTYFDLVEPAAVLHCVNAPINVKPAGGRRGIGRDFDRSLWPGGRTFELSCYPGGRDIWIFVRTRDHKSFPGQGISVIFDLTFFARGLGIWQQFFGKCQNPALCHVPDTVSRTLCPGHKICVCNKCCACGQTGKHLCQQQCVRNNVSSFARAFTDSGKIETDQWRWQTLHEYSN